MRDEMSRGSVSEGGSVLGSSEGGDVTGQGLREGVSWLSLHLLPAQTVRELLENPVQPINDMSYFGCLDSVMENSKVGLAGPP